MTNSTDMDVESGATSARLLAVLSEPFHASVIKTREAPGGKQLRYLELMTVVDRLNSLGVEWSVDIIAQERHPFGTTNKGEARTLLKATVALTIEGLGRRSHVGVQVVNSESGGEDLWKGAISDAIKKAASLFGVGRELYSDPEPADSGDAVYTPAATPQQDRVQEQRPPQPPQQYQSTSGVGNAGAISPKQLDFVLRLAYERGYTFADFKDAHGMSSAEASQAIDQLMKKPKVNNLERGQQPPDTWFEIPF